MAYFLIFYLQRTQVCKYDNEIFAPNYHFNAQEMYFQETFFKKFNRVNLIFKMFYISPLYFRELLIFLKFLMEPLQAICGAAIYGQIMQLRLQWPTYRYPL